MIIEQYYHGKKINEYISISSAMKNTRESEKNILTSLQTGECINSYVWKYKTKEPPPTEVVSYFCGKEIKRYENMSMASKESGEPEYVIKTFLSGIRLPQSRFEWRIEDKKIESKEKEKKVIKRRKKEIMPIPPPTNDCIDKKVSLTFDFLDITEKKVYEFISKIERKLVREGKNKECVNDVINEHFPKFKTNKLKKNKEE